MDVKWIIDSYCLCLFFYTLKYLYSTYLLQLLVCRTKGSPTLATNSFIVYMGKYVLRIEEIKKKNTKQPNFFFLGK